ncbi:CBM96 family carbohydrate-binding protein [Pontiella sulfatireligans]|uniref:Uncharacterized protein n=1 Tax=Pontiella sulfatireligans TaxID=2750658 RepID=A0A6C2UHL6_9BACT|nr:DNRLRE domain-containing protein [Pontiella sulfatireligans]VGO19353.1 hypothetical protein SCARR_01411 [Pontiella sulfatireligans]
MRRAISILMLCGAGQVLAADYYVSTNGSDLATGNLAAPFATIQKAADVMGAGDTCHIRGGNYHEEVVIDNLDGTAGNPVVFTAYNNEIVTLDGSQDVGDLGSSGWAVHSGNIYKTTLSSEISQVFVNDEWMMLARWPNARFDDESAWTWDNWAQGDESVSTNGWEFDDSASGHDLAASGLDMTGAMGVLNLGNFSTKALVVTNHAAGVNNFMYDSSSLGIYKTVNHYYFFDSKLNLLDNETEWYFDPATRNLYLWAPGGGVPANVRGKNQDNAFFFTNSQHIQVKGLNFFATTFRMDNCDNMTVEDCDLQYPCFNKRTLRETGEIFGTRIEDCTYVKVLNCSFANTDGLVMKIRAGNHNTVENCELHHLDYTVAHHSGNSGFIWFNSSEFGVFRNNTVYTTGASEGVMTSSDMLVELNDISGGGQLQSDGAMVHLFQGQENVDVARNWFHGNRKPALRMSDGPKDYLPPAMEVKGVARHNVVFGADFLSLQFKGDLKEGYNNLCEGYIRYSDDSGDPTNSGIHANSICINNATGDYIDFVAPTRTETNNWETVVEGVSITTQVRDRANLDFRPGAGSDFIDAGSVVPGITDGYFGSAPDIGAYESGDSSYWIPGRKLAHATTPVPPDMADGVKTNADLMWLEGYQATSHKVYFGIESGNLPMVGNQTNNIFNPDTLVSGETYYWRVDAVTPTGTVPGTEWQFRVETSVDAGTIPFVPTADSYVQDTAPNTNYGDADFIKLITPANYTYTRHGYMKFNVDVPGNITSATLELHNSGGTHNKQVGVYSMTDVSWEEDLITWSNRPPIDGVQLDFDDVDSGEWAAFDVSAAVVSNGWVSFGLIRGVVDTQRGIDSRESAYPPVLKVSSINTSPAHSFVEWVDDYDVDAAGYHADPDGDHLDNLTEYAIGGAPDDFDDAPHPIFENLEYVYRRRTDAAARGLSYALEECTNLISNDWSTVTDLPFGTAPLGAGFEAVTNKIPTTEENQFIRLHISLD